MVKKKKCWRKEVSQYDFIGFRNTRNKRTTIEVSQNINSGLYQTFLVKNGNYSLLSGDKLLPKNKAINVANSYMKKHNVC